METSVSGTRSDTTRKRSFVFWTLRIAAAVGAVLLLIAVLKWEKKRSSNRWSTLVEGSPTAGELTEFASFRFDPSATEARFVIGEILGGAPNTVIGVNDEISGEILISVSNPAASRIGPIEIGAASFVTDSSLRNRAISQFVLQSGIYPLITFTPTSIGGIPGEVNPGAVFALQIAGDLTIREVTQPVSFAATVTVVSESEIQGKATATISRFDFELTIPSVPRVAGVDEQLILELDFVAHSG